MTQHSATSISRKQAANPQRKNSQAKGGRKRTNAEWLAELAGAGGHISQVQAHGDLFNYLFVVVRNLLQSRRTEYVWLAIAADEELVSLAEDMVQICLEKISRNEWALLSQFSGNGAFTSWAAQIALNETRTELRRARWRRLQPLTESAACVASDVHGPEQQNDQSQLTLTLHSCLNQMPVNYRTVLIRCVMNGERAADVAQDLKRSAQAVYSLCHKAKKELGALLAREGVGPEDLAIFY